MSMLLYGNPESGHAYKVKLFMDVAEIPHAYECVDIFVPRDRREEPFRTRSLSKFGEVPLLCHDERIYAQSNAILIHLAQVVGKYGAQDDYLFARTKEWLLWEANKLGLSLPHLRLARNYFPDDFEPGAVAWLQRRYDEDMARLERELSDGRAFVLGDEITVADFSICGYLFFANQAKVEVPDRVRSWLSRIKRLSGWRAPFQMLSPDRPYTTFGIVKEQYDPDRRA